MKIHEKLLILLVVLLSSNQLTHAQHPKWDDPNSLPIWMTPEEESRKHEIGKNFLKSAAITGEFRNVAEFERMEGVLVRYPLGLPTSLIAAWSKVTVVYTLVSSTTYENNARSAYQSAGANLTNCKFIRAATDSYWTRDYGPWFVVNEDNQMSIVDFPYNRPRANDNAVNGVVANYFGVPMYSMPVIHAGGNYMNDGWGISASTNLVYEENSNNQTWVKQQMHDYLGIDTYHVTIDPLGDYIKHIDCWGKFLDVDKVLITRVPTNNSNYSKYEQMASYFASQPSAYGTPYQVFRVYSPSGQPYTNSLIMNDRVYVPISSSTPTSTDNAALEAYRSAMPGYTVTGIYYSSWASTDALHCRVIGLADRKMLYIKHKPVTGTMPYQSGYEITADIIPLSELSLKSDSLFLIYKTNVRAYDTINLVNAGGSTYRATLPVNPGETEVSYYLYAVDNAGKREKHPFIGKPDPHTFRVNTPLILANFTANATNVAVGQVVTFTDNSTGGPFSSWSWNFGQDAVPSTANTQGPHAVYFNTPGSKTVSLTLNGLYTGTKNGFISVVVPVTGITLNPANLSLIAGQVQQLTATILPANATNQTLTWTSSNPLVASVSSAGMVTGTGSGSAVITVSTNEGGYTSTTLVKVTAPVTGVTVSPGSATLDVSETVQLTATVLPSVAENKAVLWSSSDPSVASVNSTGLVSALDYGNSVITVVTEDGGFSATSYIEVAVTACSYETINFQNFDSTWGIWTDGGTDCARTTYYPNSAPYSIQLRDNTTSSVMSTSSLDLSAYEELTVNFSYYPYSFDNSAEDFWLQISTNGGTTYTTIEEWNLNGEFVNYRRYNDAVVIPGPFTKTTRLRFRCDASADDDRLFIDDVAISGCRKPAANLLAMNTTQSVRTTPVEPDLVNGSNRLITIYPNPTNGKVTISPMGDSDQLARIKVISSTGQVLMQKEEKENIPVTLDLSGVVSGLCIVRIETENAIFIRQVIVNRH